MEPPIKVHRRRAQNFQYSYLVVILSNWVPDNWVYRLLKVTQKQLNQLRQNYLNNYFQARVGKEFTKQFPAPLPIRKLDAGYFAFSNAANTLQSRNYSDIFRERQSRQLITWLISSAFPDPELLKRRLLQKSEGNFSEQSPRWILRGIFQWIFSGPFPWKQEEKPTQKSTAKSNQKLGVSRPKSTLQGSGLENYPYQETADPEVEGSTSYQGSVTPLFRGMKASRTLALLCFVPWESGGWPVTDLCWLLEPLISGSFVVSWPK